MSRTTTRRPGRLRALVAAGALAISMVAGASVPALADDVPPPHANGPSDHAPGLAKTVDARSNAAKAPWNDHKNGSGSDFSTQGWSWF